MPVTGALSVGQQAVPLIAAASATGSLPQPRFCQGSPLRATYGILVADAVAFFFALASLSG